MDCEQARERLLDLRRGALSESARAEVTAHLEGCQACRGVDAADAELSAILERHVLSERAPARLRAKLDGRGGTSAPPRRRSRAMGMVTVAAACAALALTLLFGRSSQGGGPMAQEAINDHLRILYSEHPVEVESGGIHTVKPWFTGRVDFAPVVPFAGDDDFPLQGGSVAYFIDRKAAAFLFKRRLHTITLLVFEAQGLPWPSAARARTDAAGAITSRGFHVLLWRAGDLGYALVSDVDTRDLAALRGRIETRTP